MRLNSGRRCKWVGGPARANVGHPGPLGTEEARDRMPNAVLGKAPEDRKEEATAEQKHIWVLKKVQQDKVEWK